jgi:hypothetical protein
MTPQDKPKPHEPISIIIDRKEYKVEGPTLTGAELRQVASPAVGDDYDLFLEVPGKEDELIANDQSVALENGMHFFSVQRHITPGA